MMPPDLLVYGGTFDPPHRAHVAAAAAALARFPRSKLLVVPAAAPAGAAEAHKQPATPFDHRLDMCMLAFRSLGARADVSTVELTLPAPNYTLSTLKLLKDNMPNASLAFLMGQDQLATFAQWRSPESILALASLVVVPRGDGEPLRATADRVAQKLALSTEWLEDERCVSLPSVASAIHVLDAAVGRDASSSLRARLAAGEGNALAELPPEVASYIKHHQLYIHDTRI